MREIKISNTKMTSFTRPLVKRCSLSFPLIRNWKIDSRWVILQLIKRRATRKNFSDRQWQTICDHSTHVRNYWTWTPLIVETVDCAIIACSLENLILLVFWEFEEFYHCLFVIYLYPNLCDSMKHLEHQKISTASSSSHRSWKWQSGASYGDQRYNYG